MNLYKAGDTGNAVFEKMKEARKSHRKAVTLAKDAERDEFALSKYDYRRDRDWAWEEEESDQGAASYSVDDEEEDQGQQEEEDQG